MKHTQEISYLFVTCCLEETRGQILKEVVENLKSFSHVYSDNLTVFDNGSTLPWVAPYLKENFSNVFVCDINTGYWSAIYWWLRTQQLKKYSYIIESDMIHYSMEKLSHAEKVLNTHDEIGSVRCQQYSVENMYLYDKNHPHKDSKRNVWQSHINKVTKQKIKHELIYSSADTSIYKNNFLTQLPALNRNRALTSCFEELSGHNSFCEFDFQKKYHDYYEYSSILDGGIYHHDPGCVTSDVVTGSWTNPQDLKKMGYKGTRFASIEMIDPYKINKII